MYAKHFPNSYLKQMPKNTVIIKLTKTNAITDKSKRFSIGFSINENSYGPLIKVVFN